MNSGISVTELSNLIGSIYDCAIDPARWPDTLAAISRAIGCATATLAVQDLPTGTVLLTVNTGIPDAYIEASQSYGAEVVDLWGGIAAYLNAPLDEPILLSETTPRDSWPKNRYFRDIIDPQGLTDLIVAIAVRDNTTFASVGFGRRGIATETIATGELVLLRLLLPHLQRAVSISRLLDIKTIRSQTFEAALDELSAGIVLVGNDLRIVHSNEAGQAILESDAIASNENGLLTLHSDLEHQALAAAVAQAGADEARIGRRGFGIPMRARDGSPAVLTVLPLRGRSLRAELSPSAVAAVFFAPAGAMLPAPEETLAALFDLTPTEGKVFSLIAAGKTLMDAATALGISRSTAKTHLERIFAKTGTGRQAELIKLAGGLLT